MSEGMFVEFAHLLRPALQENERKKLPGATHLVPDIRDQVLLLCACFVFEGATLCNQLLVRQLSQR